MIYDANKNYDTIGVSGSGYMCHQSCARDGDKWEPYTKTAYFNSLHLCMCFRCHKYFNPSLDSSGVSLHFF